MIKFLFCVAIFLSSSSLVAQINYDEIANRFLLFYNAETPDSIFALYAPPLKEKLPIDKTRAVFTGLHIQYGELRSLVLLKQDSGFNMYKASFSHQTLTLLLALNEEDLIEGFRLVPYNPNSAHGPENKR